MEIIVHRTKLSLIERLYLPGIFRGLTITLGHAIRSLRGKTRVTVQYPEQQWDKHLPDYYRGAPTLVKDEQGRERCVSCQLCEFICPPRAIRMTPAEIPNGEPWRKAEKFPQTFEIDMLRCIYCGMCEEVCPEEAIFLRKDYAITGESRGEVVHNKLKLYEIGGVREGLLNKWNEIK